MAETDIQKTDPENPTNGPEKPKRKIPAALLVAVAVIGVLVLGGVGTTYYFFSRDYNAYLDQLEGMIADTEARFEAGAGGEGATLADEWAFYTALGGEVNALGDKLAQLNGYYPLLLFRATERSTGIAALKAGMADLSPKLDVLKTCLDEDAGIALQLTETFMSEAGSQGPAYTGLFDRNAALYGAITSIAFASDFEEKRLAFAAAVERRGKALDFLVKDATVNDRYVLLFSDLQTKPADMVSQLTALSSDNDALTAEAAGVDLEGITPQSMDTAAIIGGRKASMAVDIRYFTEIMPIYDSVAQFSGQLSINVPADGKFAEKVAAYMTNVQPLNELEAQLTAINDKQEYIDVSNKRTLETMDMPDAGKMLLTYKAALTAVSQGLASSGEIETTITDILEDNKMNILTDITALEKLDKTNGELIAALAAEVPEDLKAGLANFAAGCAERSVFLDEYMAYVNERTAADGFKKNYNYYLAEKKKDQEDAAYWKSTNEDLYDHYMSQANLHGSLAAEENSKYKEAVKKADARQAAYEASREKYLAMFAAQ